MFVYAGGRRSGKTGKMIEWFLADPQKKVIITPNRRQAEHIRDRIKASMGKDFRYYDHIVVWYDAEQFLRGEANMAIGIENFDMILHIMFGRGNLVEFLTLTGVSFDAPKLKPWWRFW